MEFKELSLEDKDIFDSYLKDTPNKTAIMNFTSLYIWKDWGGKTFWNIIEDTLCIRKHFNNSIFMLTPISTDLHKVKLAVEKLMQIAKEKHEHLCFREASTDQVKFFNEYWNGEFEIHESVNGANYIYRISDMVSLTGKQYSAKRNHINQLMRSGDKLEIKDITPEMLSDCKKYLDSWMQSHHHNDAATLLSDCQATLTALDNLDKLDIKGVCLLINGQIQGLTIGGPLNSDTVLIAIEKANSAINGAYPYINQQFLEKHWQGYTYVNREEDMGNPGLRKAKQSYHPCHMEQVFLVRLKCNHVHLKTTSAGGI